MSARPGEQDPRPWWAEPEADLLARLRTSRAGLTSDEARSRLAATGARPARGDAPSALNTLVRQLRNPLLLTMLIASVLSGALGEWGDAGIVIAMVLLAVVLGSTQEWRAAVAVAKLRERLSTLATVLRECREQRVRIDEVVPGDVLVLAAGSIVAADARLLAGKDLFVEQSALTGESMPSGKRAGAVEAATPLADRTGCVFLGTTVASGTGLAVAVGTDADTEYGRIAARLRTRAPETAFEQGTRAFSLMIVRVVMVLVALMFLANVLLDRPPFESLLFAVALAVGMSPELLPAIMSVTLASGARRMAARGVLVRRLSAIEDLGAVDVLCADKTGTLTAGVVELHRAVDPRGAVSADVLALAALNARLEVSLRNPLDAAIVRAAATGAVLPRDAGRIDEIPYDFVRKRVTVIVGDVAAREGEDAGCTAVRLVMKGALAKVLECCTHLRDVGAIRPIEDADRDALDARLAEWSAAGLRVLGVAERTAPPQASWEPEDERDFVFEGFLLFSDPVKAGAAEAVRALRDRHVHLKVLTGDHRLAAARAAAEVGIAEPRVLTGAEINAATEQALVHLAPRADVFAELDPHQKERIVRALRRSGAVVGFLGDGINDAPALHAADVGISVDSAVDVAREAADIILLRQELGVLADGIEVGRRTFANSMKYVLTTTSANFGNMVSLALASLWLPFLPLLPQQILLNNFLSDIPSAALAGDRVDRQWIERPRRWTIRSLQRFMIAFGLLSSAFDIATFAILLALVGDRAAEFRTGWFFESLVSELFVLLVVRTRLPVWQGRPGAWLLGSTLLVTAVAFVLPWLPGNAAFGLVPLPAEVTFAMVAVVLLYVAAAELLKRRLYAWLETENAGTSPPAPR